MGKRFWTEDDDTALRAFEQWKRNDPLGYARWLWRYRYNVVEENPIFKSGLGQYANVKVEQ